MLRAPILAAARNDHIRHLVATAPVSRGIVARFVAGSDVEAAVATSVGLTGQGLRVSLDHLGEDTTDLGQAAATARAYLTLLQRLRDAGLTAGGCCEVSVKLTAVGLSVDRGAALDHAREVAEAARAAGTTVTLDMEDHTATEATLLGLAELRRDFPDTGAVVQAYLHRTEGDCRDLARAGSRVRLCKGAYDEPGSVAYQRRADVDASYARCLGILMAGPGYPMVATHDPALVTLAGRLAQRTGRAADSWEYQMLHGVRPDEQHRLAAAGFGVRVYVPYGTEWYGYLMRRLAERPANVGFFLRALAGRS